jgi:hypothetical protein
MELIDELKNKFDGAEIVTLKTNEQFGFTINWLKATKKQPYHLLFTTGLSNNLQAVSQSCLEYKYIELYFCLPEYWKMEDESALHNWPVYWLNRIAEVPQKNNSWFGPGDTLPAGNPPKNISSLMEENHFILTEPMKLERLNELKLDDKKIRFLAIIPIYSKEIDFKLRSSAKVLMAKFQHKNNNELIDNYREPVVGKLNFKYLWLVLVTLLILAAVAMVILTDGEWRPLKK